MLNVMSGVGCSDKEVKEDMVMPRGTDSAPVEVHTTTEFGRRRITERNCSGAGRSSKLPVLECGCGCSEGGIGRETFHGAFGVGEQAKSLVWVSVDFRSVYNDLHLSYVFATYQKHRYPGRGFEAPGEQGRSSSSPL